MTIFFVRHGAAEEGSMGSEGDAARRLTPAGMRGMKREGRSLAALGVKVDLVLSSPYVRAIQSAEVLRSALHVAEPVVSDPRLEPGFQADSLEEILAERKQAVAIMLVGHEPSFSRVIGEITGGSKVELRKGGVARVERQGGSGGASALAWLLAPELLER